MILLTKNDGILIVLGCVIGVLATVVLSPFFASPAPASAAQQALVPEKAVIAASGTATTIETLSTKEEVAAFIRNHTDTGGADAGSPSGTTPVLLTGDVRTWQFDVDTSTFKPDEYVVTATAVTQDVTAAATFSLLAAQPQAAPTLPPVIATPAQQEGRPFIRIDPIGDHVTGDRFFITGTTSLAASEEILVEVYSSSFKPAQKSQSGEFSGATGTIRASEAAAPVTVPTQVPMTAVPTISTGRTYSTTNMQVKSVDEADIIKTDGTYIYAVAGSCVHIIRAYPAQDAKILSSTWFSGSSQTLYISGERMVLLATDYYSPPYTVCTPGTCNGYYYGSTPRTSVYVFSVKDPENPVLAREFAVDGSYVSSRMIGTQLYLVTTTQVPFMLDALTLPAVKDEFGGSGTPPVYVFNATAQDYAFTTIASADLAGTAPVDAKTFLIGSAGTVYVSPTNLYIAVPQYRFGHGSTMVHSFTLDGGKVRYSAGGPVAGIPLNQYSLDEYNGYLRIATTMDTGNWRWRPASSSMVSVLSRDMKVVGSLAGIAPGEQIYAARFMGDRLYLVTYRNTDPFFVIDLADPTNVVILGELKLPGFSEYLHPYDRNHIIGVGRDTDTGGLKLALFDVTDVEQPKLTDSESLGHQGSSSPVLDDPKAFLFDKEKDILVLPVELTSASVYNQRFGYVSSVWGGAYVYGVNVKTGFVLKGKVLHYDSYYGNTYPVKRALYIDDTLYTMSDGEIIASDLAHSLERINKIPFS